jgi:hypothetical protein
VDLLPQILAPLVIIGVAAYLLARRNRERTVNAPLRREIEARVLFQTPLARVSKLGTGRFDGTAGYWIQLRGPKRLVVGPDAFIISASQALREFVFTGPGSSIELARLRFGLSVRDCIIVTGNTGNGNVQLAIAQNNLPEIWHALAATGATILSSEVPPPAPTGSFGQSAREAPYSLQGLSTATVILLIAAAAASLAAIANAATVLGDVVGVVSAAAVVTFLVWFYRARVNADSSDWPQRLSPAWAVFGWLVPIVNFWFPFQIMTGIWRASLPAQERTKTAILPGIWWACWLLFLAQTVIPGPAHPVWYLRLLTYGAGALLEIVTAMLVQQVSGRLSAAGLSAG